MTLGLGSTRKSQYLWHRPDALALTLAMAATFVPKLVKIRFINMAFVSTKSGIRQQTSGRGGLAVEGLVVGRVHHAPGAGRVVDVGHAAVAVGAPGAGDLAAAEAIDQLQIGRASCRERV